MIISGQYKLNFLELWLWFKKLYDHFKLTIIIFLKQKLQNINCITTNVSKNVCTPNYKSWSVYKWIVLTHQYHVVCAASGCNSHITKHAVLKTLSWSKIHTGRRWNPFSEWFTCLQPVANRGGQMTSQLIRLLAIKFIRQNEVI
mgnify:CR=1 FL=1